MTAVQLALKIHNFQQSIIATEKDHLERWILTDNERYWAQQTIKQLQETLQANTKHPFTLGPIQLKRACKKQLTIDSLGNIKFR